MKVDLCTTLNRIECIRQILKEKDKINIHELSAKSKIPPTTTSFYLNKYLKGSVKIEKSGREKFVSLVNNSKSSEELKLIHRENKIGLAEDLRRKGLTYSEIKKSLVSKGYYMADGQISEKIRNVNIEKNNLARYHKKIASDRIAAGKVGGKARVSMENFKEFQMSGTESLREIALARIPASSREITREKAWIIGHCIFDGSVIDKKGCHVIAYTNKSKYLITQFKKNMFEVYHLNPTDLRKREGNIYVIRYCSIAAVKDIGHSVKREIPKFIMDSCKDWKILFLKTFWDDEGAVHFSSRKDPKGYTHLNRYVEAFCENDMIRNQLIILHKELGLEPKEYRKRIKITDKNNLGKFAKMIGFSRGIYLSYPKSKFHGVEKRKILNLVVKSYK